MDRLKEDNAKHSITAAFGDIVTLDLELIPENDFVPEPLFDSNGVIRFVLGFGNFLPGLHELMKGCRMGEYREKVSIDAGFGGRNDDLVIRVDRYRINELVPNWKPKDELELMGSPVRVVSWDENSVLIDCNPPLAGSSYLCSFKVLSVERGFGLVSKARQDSNLLYFPQGEGILETPMSLSPLCPKKYQVALFSLGCFWGAELAFSRTIGVVATRAGYCPGVRKRRESVMVLFDEEVITFETLIHVALDRSRDSQDPFTNATLSQFSFVDVDKELGLTSLFHEDDDEEEEGAELYSNAIYYQNEDQHRIAASVLKKIRYGVDLLKASTFYDAEEADQQYLYKGGQSTRKNEKIKIRCYG